MKKKSCSFAKVSCDGEFKKEKHIGLSLFSYEKV